MDESKRVSHQENVNKLTLIHKDKYKYLSDCSSALNRIPKYINIECHNHGIFSQDLNSHKQGHGCPECARQNKGWSVIEWQKAAENSKHFDSFKVYVIECYNDFEKFIKIGRTFTTITKRFNTKKALPYRYRIIKEFIFQDSLTAYKKETELHEKFKKFSYKPQLNFSGETECFSININKEIKNYE